MNDNDKYKLMGYLNILERMPPNGRTIHQVKNKIQGLRLLLDGQVQIQPEYEEAVKQLIRKNYLYK